VFIAIVTWLAARLTVQGSLSIGELLAVYGYVTVLVVPVSQFTEGIGDLARGLVGARRTIDFLSVPEGPDEHLSAPIEADAPARRDDGRAALSDPASGLRVTAGSFVVVVATGTDLIDFVDHLSGRAAPPATWDGPPDRDGASAVVVVQHGSMLFPGTLRSMLSTRDPVTDQELSIAIKAAAAEDIVAGLPDGLDSEMSLDARNVSGGQRQRLLLARALAHDPEVLVLVDPTSAVDSQTEAVMVSGLQTSRAGRTTIVVASSPALLSAADSVALVAGGKVVAEGSHDELLARTPAYRSALSSTGEEEPDDGN
jgi:ABC-type multidrug transport system fused ATPase/permease subunit